MSATPWTCAPAPMLGQHSDASWTGNETAPTRPETQRRGLKPLSGLRVIDFTNAVAGPIASFILADLGAEVIKVEAPGSRPKVAAGVAPLLEGAEASSYNRIMTFNELNHGKRSLALDVATAEGRELFLALAAKSDVVVQNSRRA
ncbi:MAG: CoA transferase [Dehalococcoidia bacterium]|nr:CoA transferase [Dehalococcoidia bacterium]